MPCQPTEMIIYNTTLIKKSCIFFGSKQKHKLEGNLYPFLWLFWVLRFLRVAVNLFTSKDSKPISFSFLSFSHTTFISMEIGDLDDDNAYHHTCHTTNGYPWWVPLLFQLFFFRSIDTDSLPWPTIRGVPLRLIITLGLESKTVGSIPYFFVFPIYSCS